jgi:hypothetical protein
MTISKHRDDQLFASTVKFDNLVTFTKAVVLEEAITFEGGLTANGDIIANAGLTVAEDLIASEDIFASGDIIVNGGIVATGDISADGITATGDIDSTADITTTGDISTDGLTATGSIVATGGINLTGTIIQALVPSTAAVALRRPFHDYKTVIMNQATGVVASLPAALGSGAKYRLIVSVTPTTGNAVINAPGADAFVGSILSVLDNDTSSAWQAAVADTFNVITLNGGTTGGLIGDEIIIEDIATGFWKVAGQIAQPNATAATPFS